MKTKIWAVIASALFILTVAVLVTTCNGCKDTPKDDKAQQVIDSLKDVIERKETEIAKLDELVSYYAQEYDSTAKVNDSLQDRGVKTVIRYKEVKVNADTAEILRVCDSLATEYEAFIFQTKETLKAADSLMTAQSTQIGEYKVQNEALKALVKNLENKIDEQKSEIDKWKKLAKRRGRAIEW
jgi:peptidoglycan hydrolase CwlO-like protein